MPSRRALIRMTPDEERAFLAARSRVIVTSNGPGGMPHPVPVNYGLDAERRIVATMFRKSQTIRNLERDPRATLLVESGVAYAELRAVVAWCDAEIVTEGEAIVVAMASIRADPAIRASLSTGMSDQVHASIAKRAVRFTARRTVSWDHAKLGGYY